MAKKVYLSPSDQTKNLYAYGNTNEAVQCGKIAEATKKALERNGGNRKKAALELGISDRTLYRRLKQYGLDKPSNNK